MFGRKKNNFYRYMFQKKLYAAFYDAFGNQHGISDFFSLYSCAREAEKS